MADYDDDDDDEGMPSGEGGGSGDFREIEIREQDRYLPIANIARIMKRVLPGNTKIAKDAKESIQACVSEFISFITSEASDKCQLEKRKTINGDDLLWAMSTLGFEQYGAPLQVYLNKYRESVKGEKPDKVKSVVAPKPTAAQTKAAKAGDQKVGAGGAGSPALSYHHHHQQQQQQHQQHHQQQQQQQLPPRPPQTNARTTTVSVHDFLGINISEITISCIQQQLPVEHVVASGLAALTNVLQQTPVDEATTTTLQFHMRNFVEQEYRRQSEAAAVAASAAASSSSAAASSTATATATATAASQPQGQMA